MPNSPFDRLPPSNPAKLRAVIKESINLALSSFKEFTESVPKSVPPVWPSSAVLQMFMAQLRAFRTISKRKETATPIQLIRDIDQRWRMNIFEEIEASVAALAQYFGNDPLYNANANVLFARQKDDSKKQLISLLVRERTANSNDLIVLRSVLPSDFQKLIDLASKMRSKQQAGEDGAKRLRDGIAFAAQEYLIKSHELFRLRSASGKQFRQFLFDLKHRPFQKRLFGLSDNQIEMWEKARVRAINRRRKQRFDAKMRAKRRYSFRRRKPR